MKVRNLETENEKEPASMPSKASIMGLDLGNARELVKETMQDTAKRRIILEKRALKLYVERD